MLFDDTFHTHGNFGQSHELKDIKNKDGYCQFKIQQML